MPLCNAPPHADVEGKRLQGKAGAAGHAAAGAYSGAAISKEAKKQNDPERGARAVLGQTDTSALNSLEEERHKRGKEDSVKILSILSCSHCQERQNTPDIRPNFAYTVLSSQSQREFICTYKDSPMKTLVRIAFTLFLVHVTSSVSAQDMNKLVESVDKDKAVESVDQQKMTEAVKDGDIDYEKAYESVDKEKAADSVDVDKAKEALIGNQ